MAGAPSDYTRGEMSIDEQARTYTAFLKLSKWGSLVLAALISALVLGFCTKAGFFGAVGTGVVVLALGILVLRDKKTAAH